MFFTTTLNGFSLYQICWLFFIYATAGWLLEVVFCTVKDGKFVNRGFLNGPVCPIYGFGAVAVILTLTPLAGNVPLIFLLGMLVTSLLELVTGFVLEKAFQTRWWDYSNMPFNIGGYVCLLFSLGWGVACVFLMEILQPLIMRFVNWAPVNIGIFILAFLGIYFVIDVTVTLFTIRSLNQRLSQIDHLRTLLRKPSDKIAENVYDEYTKWQAEIETLTEKRATLQNRLVKAFPDMRSTKYENALNELKERIQSIQNKRANKETDNKED